MNVAPHNNNVDDDDDDRIKPLPDNDRVKPAPGDDGPFYAENGCWPYVHSIVPMAVIALAIIPSENQTIVLLGALLAMYAWESFETLSSFLGNSYLAETTYDSLIGDVAVGGLSITNFWLIDQITHWSAHINDVTPYWLRLVAFLIIASPSLVMGRFKQERGYRFRYAAWAYGAFYILVGGVLFYVSAAVSDDPTLAHNIVLRTTAWILIVAALTVVASVIEPASSTFLQVLSFEAILFLVLILILVITREHHEHDEPR